MKTSKAALRICLIAPEIFPLFNPLSRAPYSDADIVMYELVQRLAESAACEVSVITGNYGQELVEYHAGALVYRVDFDAQPRWWNWWKSKPDSLPEVLKQTGAEVFVMAGANALSLPVAQFCKAKRRALVYLLMHPRDCDGTFVHGRGEEGASYRKALHMAHSLVAPTREMARMLQRTEGLKATVLPPFMSGYGGENSNPQDIIWVAEVTDWTQPEYFCRLAVTLPQASFTIFGRPRKPEYLERVVERTRDIPNLGFQNSVPYGEMDAFMEKARLLVNTSRNEGFPPYFTRAFQRGIPVMSLNVDPDGIIEGQQVGVFAQGSEVRLAQETLALCSYQRQWKRLSDNAQHYARKVLSPTPLLQEYWRVFLRAAASTKGKKRNPATS